MAFPKSDQQYALITDAATGTADTPGGLGAILTQVDKEETTEGSLNELFTVPTGSSSHCVGDGLLQREPQGQKIHLVHGSQTIGKTWSLA